MTRPARLSAIVVSYFTGPLMIRCLRALARAPEIDEIILVDNGNPPGFLDRAVAESGAAPTVLSGHGNIGFAAACNLAARRAVGAHLLFINPDAVLPEGGAARLIADARALRPPWVMGAKIVEPDGAEQQGSRRAALTPWRALVEGLRLYRFAPNHPHFARFNAHGDPCPDDVARTPVISGAGFMISKEDYFSIGGMDERYFLHVEDVDFCLRFAKAGGRVYFNPHVAIAHHKSSSRANAIRIEARKTRSLSLYFHTHFSTSYPKLALWAVDAMLWSALGVKAARRAVGKSLRLAGLRRRGKSAAVRRAKAMDRRRAVR